MLEWWVPLLLAPLPYTATAAGGGVGQVEKKQMGRPCSQIPATRPETPATLATLAAVPVTEESLHRTKALLAAHADSVDFWFVASRNAVEDGADGAFASTHQDLRSGKEGKAIVLLGKGWLVGVIIESRDQDRYEDVRRRTENKEVKKGDEDTVWAETEEEAERRLRVRVALAILLLHEVAHSVWVVRNAATEVSQAHSSSSNSSPVSSGPITLSGPNKIPPEPYHHALESVAELGCSWEAFALSGGRIQPVNLSPRCEDGLCWFAWPEQPSPKRRPQLLVPPDRDMDPRYAACDPENEVADAECEKERNRERFRGVSMCWVREVCDRDTWNWIELFGKRELRVRFWGEEDDGSGATCPFSEDGWREKKCRDSRDKKKCRGEQI